MFENLEVRCVVFCFYSEGGVSFVNQASQLKKATVHQSEDSEE